VTPAEEHPARLSSRLHWWTRLPKAHRIAVRQVLAVFPGARLAGHWVHRAMVGRDTRSWAEPIELPDPEDS